MCESIRLKLRVRLLIIHFDTQQKARPSRLRVRDDPRTNDFFRELKRHWSPPMIKLRKKSTSTGFGCVALIASMSSDRAVPASTRHRPKLMLSPLREQFSKGGTVHSECADLPFSVG